MFPVNIRVLTVGGRRVVRVHYFARDEKGSIRGGSRTVPTAGGPLTLGGAAGYVACQPGLKQLTTLTGGAYQQTTCCDDVRGVTCPECKKTKAFRDAEAAEAQRREAKAESAPEAPRGGVKKVEV